MWDFVKYAVVDSLDAVPEKYRGLYAQNADTKKFELSEAAKGIVADYSGVTVTLADTKSKLKAANDESASRRVSTTAVADYLKSIGVENINAENPLETMATHVTDLIAQSKKGGEIKVNMERVQKEAETRIATITAAKDAEKATMLKSLNKYLIGQAVTTALAAEKGNVEVLLPHIERQLRVQQDGEDYNVIVFDPAKNEVRTNGAGQSMTVADLVKEFKGNKVYAANFESEAAAGNGAKPGNGARTTVAIKTGVERSSAQKISAGLAAATAGRK